MSQDFRVYLSTFCQNKSHLLMLGKVSPFRITESCIKVRKSITTDYVTGASRFIGSHGSGSGKNEPRNSPLSPVQTEATVLANNFQHCWLLYVASLCTPCCMLFGVAAQSLKPVKLLATCKRTQQLTTLLGVVASVCTQL